MTHGLKAPGSTRFYLRKRTTLEFCDTSATLLLDPRGPNDVARESWQAPPLVFRSAHLSDRPSGVPFDRVQPVEPSQWEMDVSGTNVSLLVTPVMLVLTPSWLDDRDEEKRR